MRRLSLVLLALLPAFAPAQSLTVTSPKDATQVVLTVPGGPGFWQIDGQKGNHYGQKSGDTAVLLVPELKAGKPVTVSLPKAQILLHPVPFEVVEVPGQHVDVKYGSRKVLRFMNMKRDGTTKDTHELTFKPFHHVFDPEKGETLLTNGAGLAANKDLLFPHHRGLFFAFNKVSYGNESCDVWHGRNGEYTEFERMISTEAGPTYARHSAALSWHGKDGKVFANEIRVVTTYLVPNATMIDYTSELKTELEKVRLDGDPQHAGFHFRAAMEVAKNGKQNTYYVRPDGKGKVGETRNWEPKNKDPRTINLPWDACSFVIAGTRYTVLRMVHPDNPKETRGSERDYGRFGDYFEWDLTPTSPLRVKYRVWVQPGEMTVEQCQALYNGFAVPPTITKN
jgi:hypothetical protein